jgi:hypothetical protein
VPTGGDTQVGGRDFANSIFYDNISGKQSQASACQNVSDSNCQATEYDISNKPYRRFSATLGVTNSSPSSNDNAVAHWMVIVDGTVLKSGTFESNSSPRPVTVPIDGGHVLELLVSTTDPGLSESINVVWGSVQLS